MQPQQWPVVNWADWSSWKPCRSLSNSWSCLQAACAGAGAAIWNAEKTGLFLTVWVSQAHFGIWIVGLLLGVLKKQFLVFGCILNLRNAVPFSTVPTVQFPLAVHLSDKRDPMEVKLRDEKHLLTFMATIGSHPSGSESWCRRSCRAV